MAICCWCRRNGHSSCSRVQFIFFHLILFLLTVCHFDFMFSYILAGARYFSLPQPHIWPLDLTWMPFPQSRPDFINNHFSLHVPFSGVDLFLRIQFVCQTQSIAKCWYTTTPPHWQQCHRIPFRPRLVGGLSALSAFVRLSCNLILMRIVFIYSLFFPKKN